jgi:uncharacterized protein YndB with AHSA1/START domain
MLRIALYILAGLAALLAGFLAYAATKPDSFEITRSIDIAAPPAKIFPLINDLRAFNTWNPFLAKDPAVKLTYSGPQTGQGAGHGWDGNGDVGSGSLEIVEAAAPTRVAMRLDMVSPMEAHNAVQFTLVPAGGGTKVTWQMRGPQPFLGKVMDAIFDVDAMVGGDFETGLASLKVLAEK